MARVFAKSLMPHLQAPSAHGPWLLVERPDRRLGACCDHSSGQVSQLLKTPLTEKGFFCEGSRGPARLNSRQRSALPRPGLRGYCLSSTPLI